MNNHCESDANSHSANVMKSPIFQGTMGLHQNNYKSGNSVVQTNTANFDENTIVEVFRKFKDRCILKFRDGISGSPVFKNKLKGSGILDICLNIEYILWFFMLQIVQK